MLSSATYGYTGGYRMQSATDNTGATAYSATYSYIPGSALVSQVVFAAGGTQQLVTSNSFDYVNRLLSVNSAPTADSPVQSSYQYNQAGQRVRNALANGGYWRYDYDRLGQVRSGRRYWADGTPVAGQQFDYAFDDIGNRTSSKVGGDADGLNLSMATYSVNNLNQYVSRSMTGAVEVVGLGYATNAVLVNGQTAYRKGEYFWKELLTNNASAPLWVQVQTTATNQTTQTGLVYVPQNPQTFTNDVDGNLVRDGQWAYGWDAENRLVTVAASGTVGPQISLRFEYDAKGRRIRKQVWSNKTFTGTPTNDAVFLYDGWNVVAELNVTNQNVVRSYLWGLDLSGSVQGAGGVGGLLKVGYVGAQTTNAFVAFDGNGNVNALVNAADGKIIAQYEYAPFGEVIRATGAMAKANPFRFSTQYQDDETDFLCYLRRYYNPSTGRWLSRDPAGQYGGANPYLFVKNNTLSHYDVLGLWNSDVHQGRTIQWARQVGVDQEHSIMIGVYDDGIDSDYSTYNFDDWNWGWHFNRSRSGDSRLMHRDAELQKAKARCTNPTDDAHFAAEYLGRALHPLQDWVAHGDFNRKIEEPSLTGFHRWEKRYYWHNWDALYHTAGLYGPGDPDNPEMDANGPDGRATIDTLQTGTLISNGDQAYWTGFHGGQQRINKTENLTKEQRVARVLNASWRDRPDVLLNGSRTPVFSRLVNRQQRACSCRRLIGSAGTLAKHIFGHGNR